MSKQKHASICVTWSIIPGLPCTCSFPKETRESEVEQIRKKVYDCKADYYTPDANVDAIGVQLDMRKKILDAIGWPAPEVKVGKK